MSKIDTLNLTQLLGSNSSQLQAEWKKLSPSHRADTAADGRSSFHFHASKRALLTFDLIPTDDIWRLPPAFAVCLLLNPLRPGKDDDFVLSFSLEEVPRDGDEIYNRYKIENAGRVARLWTLAWYRDLIETTYRDFIRLVDASTLH